ncbi:MAG TPA: HNH endonuclease signature motif containing protein [Nocardioidaceae bacterium]|nr:HNH endonuclease signature motif containing protein [Nocardioidaceae bacterium]
MIDERVRELVGELRPGTDACRPDERVDRIAALDRAINILHAALSVETTAFAEQRRAEDVADGIAAGSAGRGAATELGMARRVSKETIEHQLAFAKPLVDDLPQLLAACLDGQVSQAAAKHVVKACETLDREQRRELDGDLTELAVRLTPGQVKKAADRRVAAADPGAAIAKARKARAEKSIRAIVNGDGTGTLLATLPIEQAVASWQALDDEARGRRADGDERPIRALMCDLFVERVTGRTPAVDLNLEVGVVISASSLLGVDDQPAKVIGHQGGDYGVLPAGLARELAGSESAWARRLVCDPLDGTLLSMDTRKRRFDGALRKFLLHRDGTSRRPFSDAPIYEIDHAIPYADGGSTAAANGHGLAKHDHRIRDLPRWRIEPIDGDTAKGCRWTTPTGHTYTSRPPPILGYGNARPRLRGRRADE